MKTYALSAILCYCIVETIHGKIINGYERDLANATQSFKNVSALPKTRATMYRLEQVRRFFIHYDLTNILLHQFKLISPATYMAIDTLADRRGRRVDVYVKFVDKKALATASLATTNLTQSGDDDHLYVSEYGKQSVSITVTLSKHSLFLLAHEFGHASYQVPNLAAYASFVSRFYRNRGSETCDPGHKPHDPSGKQAEKFERTFRLHHARYCKLNKEKPDPNVIFREVTRRYRAERR